MEIFQDMETFHYIEIFQDMEGLVQKLVGIYVKIQDMEIILDMEGKHHTLLHCSTIGIQKQIYCQVYNLYAYAHQ